MNEWVNENLMFIDWLNTEYNKQNNDDDEMKYNNFGTRWQDTVQHKPTQINRPYHGFDHHFDG